MRTRSRAVSLKIPIWNPTSDSQEYGRRWWDELRPTAGLRTARNGYGIRRFSPRHSLQKWLSQRTRYPRRALERFNSCRGYRARKLLKTKLVPRVGVEPTRPYGQRILSPISRTTPSLTKHNKPIFSGIVSRQSQLHSVRLDVRSRHLHVIRATESRNLAEGIT